MANFVKLATIHDVPAGSMRAFGHGDYQIAIYHVGDTFYATSNVCSHEYALLSEGFLEDEDCTVECPLHGSRFDISSGTALTLPAYEPIPVYEVQLDGEDILVALS